MTRLLTALSAASLLLACATTPEPQASATIIEEGPPPPKNLERMGFTVQIPNGWEEITSPQAKKVTGENGAAIAKPEIMAVPNYNSANIVIRTVTRMDTDPKDPAACTKTADALAKVQQSTVDSGSIVSLPSGETCQVALSGLAESPGGTDRKTKATIMAAPNNNYVFSCYYDGRDAAAAKACDDTLKSFTFKAVAAPPPAETMPPTTGTETTGEGASDTGTTGTGTATGTGTTATSTTGTTGTGTMTGTGTTGTGTPDAGTTAPDGGN